MAQKATKIVANLTWGVAKSIMTMSVDKGMLEAGFSAAEMTVEKGRQMYAKKYAGKFAAFASFEATVAVGLTNGEVWLLDAATLAPLRSVEASEAGVASVALSSDVLVVGDAEGVVVAFDF